jgi:hypothetical protein
LTLKFKHGLTTTLLYTESLTPFSTLITELLESLHERYPNGLPDPTSEKPSSKTTIPIPAHPKHIRLATLTDSNDPSSGWTELDLQGGKLKISNPKTAGLKDGGILAFRILDGAEAEDDEDEEDSAGTFQVLWPSYDEAYPGEKETGGDEEDDEEMSEPPSRYRS